ncbi:MAG: efflux RND transporter periplasmic adaptor subunit [Candidatus Aminicenantes bacterium]|nr:efflux RND transporter periplasmic adaptor subunit [Candidatus Aminicenantes bacterium]
MKDERSFFQRKKKTIIILAAALILALIVIFNLSANRDTGLKVTVDKVQRQNLNSMISASGEIKPKKNVEISAHVPGRIDKIGVKEGDRVRAGQFLLKLDSTQYEAIADRDRAMIRFYKTELESSEARRQKDKDYYDRQQKLYNESLISKEQLEQAKMQSEMSSASFRSTQHQIEQSEASLRSTMDTLSKTNFVSPIDGVITSLRVEEGEVAIIGTMNNPGTVLMTIADLSVMEAEVEVDETDIVSVKLGQMANVRVDAFPSLVIKGTVTEVGSSALQKSQVTTATTEEAKDFKVVITLNSPPENLKPGLSASADIIVAEKTKVLAVPIAALAVRDKEANKDKPEEKKGEEDGIYVLSQDNHVKFTPIQKGITGDLNIEVVSGLAEGQRIVVGPYSALRALKDGMLVKPEEPKKEAGR